MKQKIFVFNVFGENTMVFSDAAGRCVVVDPGCGDAVERNRLMEYLKAENLVPEAILVTHGPADHICGVRALQDCFGCPVYMNEEDVRILEYSAEMFRMLGQEALDVGFTPTFVKDGDVVSAAGFDFEVIGTPGHSPGGVCYLEKEKGFILTGDTLFAGSIGRYDLKFGDYDTEIKSIREKLLCLDGDYVIYPGHGPSSTIARERYNCETL